MHMSGDPHQTLHPARTTWHITFGTYGTRLHGDARPTVDRQHNTRGTPFLSKDPERRSNEQERMRANAVYLSFEQRRFVQEQLPTICERGGWDDRVAAAGPDHVHVLIDIDRAIHGEKARRLIKRWLGQTLTEQYGKPAGGTWWAEEGSNKAIHDETYLNNAFGYIADQRA